MWFTEAMLYKHDLTLLRAQFLHARLLPIVGSFFPLHGLCMAKLLGYNVICNACIGDTEWCCIH